MTWMLNLWRILRLSGHWSWIAQLAEALLARRAAVAALKPGQIASLASTDADLFGEKVTLRLTVQKRG
jgi:hypothetical protein